ncbi:beta-ketoacyl-ACP synthase III [Henriciella litoralis]|uniref:beta-ketoacyl-ACP synthase III n=1 Tax=Henriciella litoralis TaxID=568102 RepID=UPI0009FDD69A|nr:beta-ketoacyl-ACP synthase III [Henriciella litoralis]
MTRSVYITKSAAFLPGEPIGNDRMEAVLGRVGDQPSRARRLVLRSNKIEQRYYAIDPETGAKTHTNAQLTAEAIRALDIDLDSLDLLSCGTSMADQVLPNHASMVQGELGLPALEVMASSGVCLAGVSALKYGYASVLSGLAETAVATGSECASSILTADNFSAEIESRVQALETNPEIAFEKDFLRWMLSDGAGALALSATPGDGVSLKIEWIDMLSYSGEMETCMYCGGSKQEDGSLKGWTAMTQAERAAESAFSIKQDVKLLNANVIHYTVEKPLAEIAEKRALKPDDVDWFLPHYSSDFFRKRVMEGLEKIGFVIPYEKWFTNLYSRGNTGSASIFIMLDELLRSGDLEPGQTVLCWVPESGRFSAGYMLLTVTQETS